MDTKNITSIHVGNTEIQKIICGGGIVWAKNATWEKWSVKDVREWAGSSDGKTISYTPSSLVNMYASCKIDDNGNFIGVETSGTPHYFIYDKPTNTCFYWITQYPDGTYLVYKFISYLKPTRKERDKLIETVSASEGTYPNDGIHTDGYWYVKKG